MTDQCNSCGSFLGVEKCPYCPSLICDRCRGSHEPVCEFNQKKKSLGLGPTVRQVNIIPEKPVSITPENPVDIESRRAAQESMDKYTGIITEFLQNPSFVEEITTQESVPVDPPVPADPAVEESVVVVKNEGSVKPYNFEDELRLFLS